MRTPVRQPWRHQPAHRAWLTGEAERVVDFAERAKIPLGYGWLTDDGSVDPAPGCQLWINARMVHVFALAHLWGRPGAGDYIDHGLAALTGPFHDQSYGGWYSTITEDRVADDRKDAYQTSFVLLAAASALTAGRPGAAELLADALDVIDSRFLDPATGLVVTDYDRRWTQPDSYRGANASMHMVEALLAAGHAVGDEAIRARALPIATRLIHEYARSYDWLLPEHYSANWQPELEFNSADPRNPFKPYGVTPGHMFEWARLLLAMERSLTDPPGWLLEAATHLFDRALEVGWDSTDGGVYYTVGWEREPVVESRLHWVMCEALCAAATFAARTGDPDYDHWYEEFWNWTATRLIDRCDGSWHHEYAPGAAERSWNGKPDVYHIVQTLLAPRLPAGTSFAGDIAGGRLDGAGGEPG